MGLGQAYFIVWRECGSLKPCKQGVNQAARVTGVGCQAMPCLGDSRQGGTSLFIPHLVQVAVYLHGWQRAEDPAMLRGKVWAVTDVVLLCCS